MSRAGVLVHKIGTAAEGGAQQQWADRPGHQVDFVVPHDRYVPRIKIATQCLRNPLGPQRTAAATTRRFHPCSKRGSTPQHGHLI